MPWHHLTSQPLVCDLLRRSLKNRRIHHGYLFVGEESETGPVALAFARALNCEKQDGDFCERCHSCVAIARGEHPDVYAMRPESKSRRITIDQVREMEKSVYLKTSGARNKLAMVHAADRLGDEAQSAFLKTLEEPPSKTIFLLLTEEPQQLKDTILSRCLRTPFRPAQRNKTMHEQLVETWLETLVSPVSSSESTVFRAYGFTGRVLGLLKKVRDEKLMEAGQSLKNPALDHLETPQRDRLEEQLEARAQAEYVRERTRLLRTMVEWYHVHQPGPRPVEILEKLAAQLARNINESLAWEIAMLKLTESVTSPA